MGTLHIWIILFTILIRSGNILAIQEKPDNNVLSKTIISNEEISQEDEFLSANYVLPKQIFNDGKPFYVHKDPISGQFDFDSKKPAGIEPEFNEVINPKEKIVLSATQPNIHDFLNLPVKYSSSKFVNPLVSSSYANLKYQGSNKNYHNHHVGNHQNAMVPTIKTTQSPKYYSKGETKKDTTKLYPPIIATTVGRPATSTTRKTTRRTTTTTSTTAVPITTHRPLFDKLSTKYKYNSTKKYTTPSTSTTARPFTDKQNKYTRVYMKPSTVAPSTTTLTTPSTTEHTTTRKTTTSTTTTATTLRTSTKPTVKTTSEITISTKMPISTISTTLFKKSKIPTKPTKVFTSKAPSFIPMPTSDIPFSLDFDSADVYNKVNEKNEPNKMSLADIFNALAEDSNNHQSDYSQSSLNQGLDKQGNLMQPISPSVPSPFTLHQVTKVMFPNTTTSRKPYIPTVPIITRPSRPSQTEKPLQISSDIGHQQQHEIQQPNRIQYHPIPSMNNIVISPDQNSASFVLGSQQAVGSNIYVGSVEKEPLFENNRPIQFGTVINEDINKISESRPLNLPLNQNSHQGQKQVYNMVQFQSQLPQTTYKQEQTNGENEQQTQELLVSTNIRFPNDIAFSDQEQEHYFGSSNTVNGHAQPQPVSTSPNGPANPLVFPNLEQELEKINNRNEPISNSNKNIIYQPDFTQTERPLFQPKQEILTLNQHNVHNKVNFPQLHEDLTPPDAPDQILRLPSAEKLPQRHPVEQPHRHHIEQGQRPGLMRPPHLQPPGNFLYNEFTRKPVGGYRPNSDRPLPNILPQFRPNAKISQGHPTYNKEPGNIRVTHSKYPPSKRGIPPPSFAHRRTPINNVGTNRHPVKIVVERPQETNRRVYKVPMPHPHFFNRQYLHRQPPPPTRFVDSFVDERQATLSVNRKPYNGYPDSEAIPERLPSFEEDDYIVNDSAPPQPILNNRNEHQEEIAEEITEKKSKLEPVVTLQMLHSHKKASPNDSDENVSEDKQGTFQKSGSTQGVYVVYPELTMAADNQVDIIKDEPTGLSELVSSSSGSAAADYQNTPFSVVRDQPQEPILMVKNKPQSQNKDKFPYPMEKPDIAFAEFSKKQDYDRYNRETTLDTIPRVVNRRNDIENNYYQQSTEIPIAIAYTPTEPNRYYQSNYHHHSENNKFSYPNYASPVIPEIRDTQTEAAMMHDEYDTRGQNYEKDFMAPFYPSMSLDPVTDSPNGWSIFQTTTRIIDQSKNNFQDKNKINRSDMQEKSDNINEKPLALSQVQHMKEIDIETSSIQNYDQDSFQPELQGGFKPIYPPGYKIKDESSSNEDIINIGNSDSTISKLKSYLLKDENNSTRKNISNSNTSTETLTSTTNTENPRSELTTTITELTTTTTVTEKIKKKKPTSLAALLFGDYDDYDYEEKPENSIGKGSS